MGNNRDRKERTILRIRCSKELFREFKRVAVDYDDYEEALERILEAYKRYVETYPKFPKRRQKLGMY